MEPTFSMIWLIEILKTCLKEQLLIKHYVMTHLILLRFQNDGYQRSLASLMYKCFDKKSANTSVGASYEQI